MPQKLNVLIIDDEPAVLRVLRRTLERRGYAPTVAEDAQTALQTAQEREPDVILLDLRLSDTTGKEVYQKLLQQHPALRRRVIVLSGETKSSDDATWFARQGLPVLAKPFELEQLLATIDQVGSQDPS